jgi:hypothetical protein
MNAIPKLGGRFVFSRIAEHLAKKINDLLPWNWRSVPLKSKSPPEPAPPPINLIIVKS